MSPAGLQAEWQRFSKATEIRPIRDAAHYDRMCMLLDMLWDATTGDDEHPLWDVCELVGLLVSSYEAKMQWPESPQQALD